MAGHARLSASETKRWATCPGSTAILESRPVADEVDTSGIFDQLGTCAHTLVERCLSEDSESSDYLGRLIRIVYDAEGNQSASILRKGARMPSGALAELTYEVDDDMAEAVGRMTTYVRGRLEELGVTRTCMSLERRTVPLPERDDTGGTADVTLDVWPEVLEVVDYKNGAGVFVPVTGNMQLRSYALGMLQELGAGILDYERVRYTICQPRHRQAPRDGVMFEEVSVAELLEWKEWLTRRAEAVDRARVMVDAGSDLQDLFDNGFVSVGEDGQGCRFCELAKDCPAQLALAQDMAGVDFDDEPTEISEEGVGPNRLATLVPWMPFIKQWMNVINGAAEGLMMSGGDIPGLKVVRGQSPGRKWVKDMKEQDLVDFMVERGAKARDLYTEPELKSGPQAEKLIPPKEREKLEADFMVKPPGRLMVVPIDDTRPSVQVDPADDFPDDPED